MNSKLPRGTLDRLWADPKNWKASGFYSCKEDPRVFVPKRIRWAGWTVNFSNPRAWPVLIGVILAVFVPAALFTGAGLINTPIWFGSLAAFVVAICVISQIYASPKRYEE